MIKSVTIVLALLCLAAPAAVSAQRVGLAPFSGPRHRQIRRVVRSALEDRVDTVVDVEADDPVDVDAVVTGQTTGRRARPRLTLVLLDSNGSELAREELRVTANRRGQRAVNRAVGSLLEAAGDLSPAPADDPEPEPAAVDDYEEPEEEAEDSGEDRPSAGRPFLHLLVGLSLRNRSLVASTAGARQLGNDLPLYPEFNAEVRVRPLAGSGDPLLAGIRIRGRFAYALFFESQTPSAQVIGGSAWSVEGEAGWLAPIEEIAELGVSLGGGFSSYGLDDNVFVPTVEYASFEARAVTRIRAIEEELVIRAEAGYRYAAGGGPFTDSYGSVEGHGLVVEGGLEGIFALDSSFGISWLVGVEYQSTWLSFSGMPTMELAESGSESFVRGRLGVGLAFQ